MKQVLHHCGNAVDAGRCERIGKDEQLIAQTHHRGERNDNGVAFDYLSHGLVQCSHLPSSRACRQFPLASIVHLEKICKRDCKKYFCMTDAIQIHAEFDGFHAAAGGKMKEFAAANSHQPGRLREKSRRRNLRRLAKNVTFLPAPYSYSGCRPRRYGGWARCRWNRWSRPDTPAAPHESHVAHRRSSAQA